MPEEEPKLHIDDDWKSEAAADKERLADSIEEGGDRQQRIPEADFVALLQMIATQAMICFGGMQGPDGKEIPPNLDLSKHYIDLLNVIETKTAGNLNPEEKQMLDTTLHQLRLAYVDLVRSGSPNPPTA